MSKNISFIYFDLGGVMFRHGNALETLAKEYGITVKDFDKVFKLYDYQVSIGNISLQELWEIYVKKLHLQPKTKINYFDYWTDHFVPIPQTHTLAKQLASSYPIGILSNLYEHVYDKIKRKHMIPDITYETIIQSWEVKCAKPDEVIYHIAQNLAQTPSENILFIDDTLVNIKAAKKIGWHAIHFDNKFPEKSIEEIKNFLS